MLSLLSNVKVKAMPRPADNSFRFLKRNYTGIRA